MPRARRTCAWKEARGEVRVNCPQIATHGVYCEAHALAHEQARGSRQERGYDAAYDRERARIARRLLAGHLVECWRCHARVRPGSAWTLGHRDERGPDGERIIAGPEHTRCNARAAGLAAHGLPWSPG